MIAQNNVLKTITENTREAAMDLTEAANSAVKGVGGTMSGCAKAAMLFREVLYLVLAAFGIIFANQIHVNIADQGSNFITLKATVVRSGALVFSISILALAVSNILVHAFKKDSISGLMNELVDAMPFDEKYGNYISSYRRHCTTLLLVASLMSFSEDFYELDWYLKYLLVIFSGVLRLENEYRYGLTGSKTNESTRLGTIFNIDTEKISLLPAFALSGFLLIYNFANGNDFTLDQWTFGANVVLIVILGLCVYDFWFIKTDQERRVHGTERKHSSWVLLFLASITLVIFGTWSLLEQKNETSVVALLVILAIDTVRIGYGETTNGEQTIGKYMSLGFRFAHSVVGAAAFTLLYYGVNEQDSLGDLEKIPVSPKLMRDVALASAALKIFGLFFAWSVSKQDKIKLVPISTNSSENTIRQLSTIGLLISSSFLWASQKQLDDSSGLHWVLLLLGLVARLVDAIQDTYRIEGQITLDNYVWDSRINNDGDPLEKGSYDNPRSWLVISAITLSLGLISHAYNEHDSTTDRRGVANILSVVGLVVHLFFAIWGVAAYEVDNYYFGQFSLSRKRVVRLLVTSATIMALTVSLSEMGWAGKLDGMSKTPSPSNVDVTMEKWYTLGALVAYLSADLIGHVFL